ncbi:hypothetical protein [Nonomuraea typhae]|uniref:hypothetical protein n=1 Tax=Nonomuraea typhae TaxID=2603600 RepID=UPI0012FB2F5F|nr:hypothetical protein [Nonomuraea typhae]
MPNHVCSLIARSPQLIPAGPNYTLLRFPYGSTTGESYDADGMHNPAQPDGVTSAYPDLRSGLIWPAHDAWAQLYAMVQWEDGTYDEVRDRFTRDPLALFGPPDSTCTEDYAATPGGQYRSKSWGMFVHPGVPLGLMVRHNASTAVAVTLAEFKLAYHLDPDPA